MPALDFDPSASQQAIRQFLRMFGEQTLRPAAVKYDVREHERPDDVVQQVQMLIQNGAGAMGGGSRKKEGETAAETQDDGSVATNAIKGVMGVIFAEELAWGSAALMLSFPGPGLAGAAIAAAGTPAQKKKWLPRFSDGRIRWGAMAYTEAGAGSDTGAIRTTAKRDGDHWVLNGRKIFCTNGASSDIVVIWASLDLSRGKEAIRAFVVEKGTPGFQVGSLEKKMGIRSSETAELILEDCRVPLDSMLGEFDADDPLGGGTTGFKGAMATFDMTRPGVAAMAVGIARAAIEYLRDRLAEESWSGPAYGRARANQTALDDWYVEMEAQTEAARLLAHRAAWLGDRKLPNALEASMAKAKAGTVVVQVCAKVVELLGPDGATRKHPVEMWLRDSKVYDIFEGTGQVNRLVIARRVLGYTSKDLQ